MSKIKAGDGKVYNDRQLVKEDNTWQKLGA
jgi:hypothetical protein